MLDIHSNHHAANEQSLSTKGHSDESADLAFEGNSKQTLRDADQLGSFSDPHRIASGWQRHGAPSEELLNED